MPDKPTAISVIVPVVVTGILILAILAMSSTNEAFAQKKECGVSPATMGNHDQKKVSGKLTCDGSGIGGATITFPKTAVRNAITGQDGTYSTSGIIGSHGCLGPFPACYALAHIGAHYAGDSEHMSVNSKIFTSSRGEYGGP
jgi:hypothetical protein